MKRKTRQHKSVAVNPQNLLSYWRQAANKENHLIILWFIMGKSLRSLIDNFTSRRLFAEAVHFFL